MGSRIGYCVRDKTERSPIFRKQWSSSISKGVEGMWIRLSDNKGLGDGGQAIRDDLDWGRAFASLVVSFWDRCFNSIESGTNCDISDNGLIEIDITNFKEWKIYHIKVDWDDGIEGSKILIAEMNGVFTWLIGEGERELIGEGLF